MKGFAPYPMPERGGGSGNETNDIIVSTDFSPNNMDVAVGQVLTTSLGGLQGNINNIKVQLNSKLVVATAETSITKYSVVYQIPETTTIGYAQGNLLPQANAFGIILATVLSGQQATIQTIGNITNTAWNLIAGKNVYLSNDVKGGITQTLPTSGQYVVILGVAVNATTINLSVKYIGLI